MAVRMRRLKLTRTRGVRCSSPRRRRKERTIRLERRLGERRGRPLHDRFVLRRRPRRRACAACRCPRRRPRSSSPCPPGRRSAGSATPRCRGAARARRPDRRAPDRQRAFAPRTPFTVSASSPTLTARNSAPLAAVLLVERLEDLLLQVTRPAPGRPEVDQHDAAMEVAEVDRPAGEVGLAQLGRRRADAHRPRFGVHACAGERRGGDQGCEGESAGSHGSAEHTAGKREKRRPRRRHSSPMISSESRKSLARKRAVPPLGRGCTAQNCYISPP